MSCIWGRTRPWWSISLLNNDYCSLEQSIDWLNRTQKKNWISFYKKTIFLWPKARASWRTDVHESLSCSWTAHYCFLQRSREVVEVAAGRVGYWLQITGCVHTNLSAKQSVPSSSISTLQHEAMLLHSCFQCTEGRADQRRGLFTKESHPNIQ